MHHTLPRRRNLKESQLRVIESKKDFGFILLMKGFLLLKCFVLKNSIKLGPSTIVADNLKRHSFTILPYLIHLEFKSWAFDEQ